jgi:hypothetical protein
VCDWFEGVVEGGFDLVEREEGLAVIDEFGHEFLRESGRAHGGAFLLEKFARDARAIESGDGEPVPFGSTMLPGFVEEAALAARSAHEPEIAIAYGEHGAESFVHTVVHDRSFIDQDEGNGREAANIGFDAGEAYDARPVGELQRGCVIAIAARSDAERSDHFAAFADELRALTVSGTGYKDR